MCPSGWHGDPDGPKGSRVGESPPPGRAGPPVRFCNSRVNLSIARTVLLEAGRLKNVCGGGTRKMCPAKPQSPRPSPHPSRTTLALPSRALLWSLSCWMEGLPWGMFLFSAGPKGHTRRQEMKGKKLTPLCKMSPER